MAFSIFIASPKPHNVQLLSGHSHTFRRSAHRIALVHCCLKCPMCLVNGQALDHWSKRARTLETFFVSKSKLFLCATKVQRNIFLWVWNGLEHRNRSTLCARNHFTINWKVYWIIFTISGKKAEPNFVCGCVCHPNSSRCAQCPFIVMLYIHIPFEHATPTPNGQCRLLIFTWLHHTFDPCPSNERSQVTHTHLRTTSPVRELKHKRPIALRSNRHAHLLLYTSASFYFRIDRREMFMCVRSTVVDQTKLCVDEIKKIKRKRNKL